jgi:hypothetical protein
MGDFAAAGPAQHTRRRALLIALTGESAIAAA